MSLFRFTLIEAYYVLFSALLHWQGGREALVPGSIFNDASQVQMKITKPETKSNVLLKHIKYNHILLK